jgi:hypothetical protein
MATGRANLFEDTVMADSRKRKAADMVTEQADGTNRTTIDQRSLLELLDLHATKMAATIGEVIVEKLAGLKNPGAEDGRTTLARGGSRESPEGAELALEGAEEAWLAKYPADDRANLKCTDRELRELEKTLEGPQKLLEEEAGDTRPPVGRIGIWRLPAYKAVPPDKTAAAESCEPTPPESGA